MSVSEADFQQAMSALQTQLQNLDSALNARIVLEESEVLRLRSIREDGAKHVKSGMPDSRKIYSQAFKDMGRWKAWSERVLRWARMQSTDLYAALVAAAKSRHAPITHDVGDKSVFFWVHLETG